MDAVERARLASLKAAKDLAMQEYFAAHAAGGPIAEEVRKLSEAVDAYNRYYLEVREPTGLNIEF